MIKTGFRVNERPNRREISASSLDVNGALPVVSGVEWFSEEFTGSDPLICIKCQHGLQELDTLLSLYSLSFVIFLQTHLVKEPSVKFTISQVILTIMKRQSIIVTTKVASNLSTSRSSKDGNLWLFLVLLWHHLKNSKGA